MNSVFKKRYNLFVYRETKNMIYVVCCFFGDFPMHQSHFLTVLKLFFYPLYKIYH